MPENEFEESSTEKKKVMKSRAMLKFYPPPKKSTHYNKHLEDYYSKKADYSKKRVARGGKNSNSYGGGLATHYDQKMYWTEASGV